MAAYWDSEQGRMVGEDAPAPTGKFTWATWQDPNSGGDGGAPQMISGWKDISQLAPTDQPSAPPAGAPAAPGPALQLISPDIRESSLGVSGPLFKGDDGYYTTAGKASNITDAMIPGLLGGADTRQQQAIEHNKKDNTVELAAMAGFAGMFALGAAGAGMLGTGSAEIGAVAEDASMGAAATGGASVAPIATDATGAAVGGATAGGGDLGATAAFEADAATVPAATSSAASTGSTMLDTALKGAAKSAVINGATQLATTGKIDPASLLKSAAAGGFGSLVAGEIGGFTGQVAGAVTGAVVGGALSPDNRTAGIIGGAAGGLTGGDGGVPAPTVNAAGLTFNDPGIIAGSSRRLIDWATPRMNWSGHS